MPCGPTKSGLSVDRAPGGQDPFSFGQDMWGFSAMALVWTAPWRAASVVMSEALREGLGNDD